MLFLFTSHPWLVLPWNPLLAQASLGAAEDRADDTASGLSSGELFEMFQQLNTESEALAQAWDQHWMYALNGPVYMAMSYAGIVCAVSTLLFFMMQWAKDLNEGNLARPLSELVWPILVAVLLTPTPSVSVDLGSASASYGWNGMARITQQVRLVFDRGDTLMLNVPGMLPPDPQTGRFLTNRDAYRQAEAVATAHGLIQAEIAKCFSASGKEQRACLTEAIEASEGLLETYQRIYQPIKWMQNRIQDLEDLQELVDNKLPSEDTPKDSKDPSERQPSLSPADLPFWAVGNPQSNVKQFFNSAQMGFLQILEIGRVGTSILGPVALGCSLLPVPIANKMVLTWFSGLCALSFAKICYGIILGMAASVLLQSAPQDPSWYTTFSTVFAPLLAIGLATGGGMALFNALSTAASPFYR